MRYLLDSLTDRIIACYHSVRRQLPLGLDLSSYLNALAVDCRRAGMRTASDRVFGVRYRGELVGEYRAALVVESLVIVEPRQSLRLAHADRQHLMGCLRAAGVPVGLALNFGDRAEVWRAELWPAAARIAERHVEAVDLGE